MLAIVASTAAASAGPMPYPQPDAAAIQHALHRLPVAASALYVAAHPDDENTRLIAHLANERQARTAYLSMTRGDGGQNLIGTEQSERFGLIRTAELMGARALDGGEQMFTRAKDFGYSKTPEETLEFWGREEILADTVWAIRMFRPDIIITRFKPAGRNHGHHTASAILAAEAFEMAGDRKAFPEQLEFVEVWKPERLIYNVSTWRLPKDADMSAYPRVDVGGYNPLLGASYGELAAESRSMHKSQGFGVQRSRGPKPEYFKLLSGRPMPDRGEVDLFADIDTSLARIEGAGEFDRIVKDLIANYDSTAPHLSVAALAKAHAAIARLADADDPDPWAVRKKAEVEALMLACAGLWLEARAPAGEVVVGTQAPLALEALLRAPKDGAPEAMWTGFSIGGVDMPRARKRRMSEALAPHEWVKKDVDVNVPTELPATNPYWIRHPQDGERFHVPTRQIVGQPVGERAVWVDFFVTLAGRNLQIRRAVQHSWRDPVQGERYQAVTVAPPVTASPAKPVSMFPNGEAQIVAWQLEAFAPAKGTLSLSVPRGWRVTPATVDFDFSSAGQAKLARFEVTPSNRTKMATRSDTLRAQVTVDGRTHDRATVVIDYPHIPKHRIYPVAETRAVTLPLTLQGQRIGYVPGAGDQVAESLALVGYDVSILNEDALAQESYGDLDAVILGVRAFNKHPWLKAYVPGLIEFAKAGGTVIVQYNTSNWISKLEFDIGPYPLELGRDRVTDETAAVTPKLEDHAALTFPNRLTPEDFDGWVQERGLYFAKTWDDAWQAPLEMADAGAEPSRGSLLVSRIGKGAYVYTGLSFFRQLPAGVPGAYRLLSNLISHGKAPK